MRTLKCESKENFTPVDKESSGPGPPTLIPRVGTQAFRLFQATVHPIHQPPKSSALRRTWPPPVSPGHCSLTALTDTQVVSGAPGRAQAAHTTGLGLARTSALVDVTIWGPRLLSSTCSFQSSHYFLPALCFPPLLTSLRHNYPHCAC